jgi:hypothetical protein
VRRLVEAVLPSRMGSSFRWLVASTWTSNLGDGIGLAAGPLLIASQTKDPLLVALAALQQRLPWLLFGLWAGVLADRLDRRMLVVGVDLARAGVLAVLTATIVTGTVGIGVILVAMLLLGAAEVFADTASQTLLPMVVDKEDLAIGNARLMAGFLTTNQLAGPALGAALFAAGMASPFLTQAVCVALGAILIGRIRVPAVEPAVGFGLLNTVGAVGGLAGIASYDWLARHASLADIMRVGLIVETFTHLGLALTTVGWVAAVILFVFGAHAFIWGTTSRTLRMRAVPGELQGRVGSLYSIGVFGGILAGQALGGVIAHVWGITGPFWFAFAGSALILALIWRQLEHIAHAESTA